MTETARERELRIVEEVKSAQDRIAGSLYLLHLINPHDTFIRGLADMRNKGNSVLAEALIANSEALVGEYGLEGGEAYWRGVGFAYLYTEQLHQQLGVPVPRIDHKTLGKFKRNPLDPNIESKELVKAFDPPLFEALVECCRHAPVENASGEITPEIQALMLKGAHDVVAHFNLQVS
jgi:hypothetical protein